MNTDKPTSEPAADELSSANPWARQSGGSSRRATNRLRKIVTGLPTWEPLPPGELSVVRRPPGG